MPDLILHTNPMSRGRTVRWMLEEVGAPYETVLVDFADTGELAKVNPMAKVPTLRHGDTVVTEAAAICAYLADAFPDAGLAPPVGSPLRGPYYRWLFFVAGPIEAAVGNAAFGFVVPKDRERAIGYGSLARVTDTLEAAVDGREHLVGDAFTAADLYLGATLGWGMAFGTIEARPPLRAYVDRLDARPAMRRARAINDALLPPRGG